MKRVKHYNVIDRLTQDKIHTLEFKEIQLAGMDADLLTIGVTELTALQLVNRWNKQAVKQKNNFFYTID